MVRGAGVTRHGLEGKVGKRIRELRERRGLTLRQVANEQVSASMIGRVENGQRSPTLEVLISIAGPLETTALELATGKRGRCPYCGREHDCQTHKEAKP